MKDKIFVYCKSKDSFTGKSLRMKTKGNPVTKGAKSFCKLILHCLNQIPCLRLFCHVRY